MNAVQALSPLVRQEWVKEGIIQKQSTSFWSPFMGATSASIVQVAQTSTAGSGHTVIFDHDGAMEVQIIVGMESAFGKGVNKKKFSDSLVVDRMTVVIKNWNKFQGTNIGDLQITEHMQSRGLLADGYIRAKDQMLFDTAQGSMKGSEPTHIFDLGTNFGVNSLSDIEDAIKTGYGFKKAGTNGAVTTVDAPRRLPMLPYMMQDGNPMYLFIVDSYMARKLKQDPLFQTIMIHGDVRGADNRMVNGTIGKLGRSLLIVEAPSFFGTTTGAGQMTSRKDSLITMSGVRQYSVTDGVVDANTVITGWEGQTKFNEDRASDVTSVFSRGIILGQGALQLANGKNPDYLYEDEDFGRESESAVEYWSEASKKILSIEAGEDYTTAIADIDFAVITVDLKHV